jgi:hypothetical protein
MQGGAILAVQLDATGPSYQYLEACLRFYVDGAEQPIFLSSGAEDFFLSAFYFDEVGKPSYDLLRLSENHWVVAAAGFRTYDVRSAYKPNVVY